MREKLKKLFSNFNKRKRLTIFTYPSTKCNLWFGAILFFIVLGIVLPLYQARAFSIASFSKGAVITLFNVLGGLFFQLLAAIGNVFLGLAAGLLGWVTTGFTSLSYTNPAGNPILEIGWTLTRDLANVGFIIILVIIGLATALKIREYQWQKTLPLLIGIALLINFTPVICGLIVDAGNIVMNFFIEDLAGWDTFGWIYKTQWATFTSQTPESFATDLSFLGASWSLAIFAFLGAAILLVYAAIFAMRYIAIWILVILSPIAFFSYILPATRGLFRIWWNQFIQWTFIGAIAGFFLYLSNNILYLVVTKGIDLKGKGVTGIVEGGSVLDGLLPYFVVIAFLYVGFFVALSTSAMGATAVISVAQKGVKTAGAWTAKKGGRGIEKGLKIPEGAERLGRWAAGKPIFGAAARPLIGYAKRRREETKKELEGLPFATRAKMTREKRQSIQDSLRDVVRGLGPREFAAQAHPDDLKNLDVFFAMSKQQVETLETRGSIAQKEILQKTLLKNAGAILAEYKKLRAVGKNEEAKKLYNNLKYIRHNYTT